MRTHWSRGVVQRGTPASGSRISSPCFLEAPQIGDHIGALRIILQAGIGHDGTGYDLLWRYQILVENFRGFVNPRQALWALALNIAGPTISRKLSGPR
jgi:hypothetical protein